MGQNMRGRIARRRRSVRNSGRGGYGRDSVRIPDPGAYKVPAEFREEIERALRDGLPPVHRQSNEQYYRELVE
jgi:hypothetical protein